jgi:hypothetical protein
MSEFLYAADSCNGDSHFPVILGLLTLKAFPFPNIRDLHHDQNNGTYNGANAVNVEQTVTPIEQQVNGVEGNAVCAIHQYNDHHNHWFLLMVPTWIMPICHPKRGIDGQSFPAGRC